MENQYVVRLAECPRCGERGYEKLGSHGHCINCNYSPAYDECVDQCVQIPDWAIQALKDESKSNDHKVIDSKSATFHAEAV